MGNQKKEGSQGQQDKADRARQSGELDRRDVRKLGERIEGMSERASIPEKDKDRESKPAAQSRPRNRTEARQMISVSHRGSHRAASLLNGTVS
jgi:hypothetical protein